MRDIRDYFLPAGNITSPSTPGTKNGVVVVPDAAELLSVICFLSIANNAENTFKPLKNGVDTGVVARLPVTPVDTGVELTFDGRVELEWGDNLQLESGGESDLFQIDFTWVLRPNSAEFSRNYSFLACEAQTLLLNIQSVGGTSDGVVAPSDGQLRWVFLINEEATDLDATISILVNGAVQDTFTLPPSGAFEKSRWPVRVDVREGDGIQLQTAGEPTTGDDVYFALALAS